MKNNFAFLFYVNDWSGGTQWMTRLQRGGYLDLLIEQVNNTCFSLEKAKLILGEDFENVWCVISEKFTQENGLFFNKKMREILDARQKFTESRRQNKLGKFKKTHEKHKKNIRKTLVKQVEKEKEREIEIENKIKKKEYKTEIEKSEEIFKEIKENQQWIEVSLMALGLNKTDEGQLISELKIFLYELAAKDDLNKGQRAITAHFISWLKLKLEKEKKQNGDERHKIPGRMIEKNKIFE